MHQSRGRLGCLAFGNPCKPISKILKSLAVRALGWVLRIGSLVNLRHKRVKKKLAPTIKLQPILRGSDVGFGLSNCKLIPQQPLASRPPRACEGTPGASGAFSSLFSFSSRFGHDASCRHNVSCGDQPEAHTPLTARDPKPKPGLPGALNLFGRGMGPRDVGL